MQLLSLGPAPICEFIPRAALPVSFGCSVECRPAPGGAAAWWSCQLPDPADLPGGCWQEDPGSPTEGSPCRPSSWHAGLMAVPTNPVPQVWAGRLNSPTQIQGQRLPSQPELRLCWLCRWPSQSQAWGLDLQKDGVLPRGLRTSVGGRGDLGCPLHLLLERQDPHLDPATWEVDVGTVSRPAALLTARVALVMVVVLESPCHLGVNVDLGVQCSEQYLCP